MLNFHTLIYQICDKRLSVRSKFCNSVRSVCSEVLSPSYHLKIITYINSKNDKIVAISKDILSTVRNDNTYFPGYDGVYDGPSVPQHEDELGAGKQAVQVDRRAKAEGVFVAQAVCRIAVASDYLQGESSHGAVQDLETE
ncbi:hypothetical protein CEXT_380821 [Caerostris extrusa]|uniref:Uncharacterized protein n=1 Tax=Caerostris extrusa TaxID=172846 RepID=A0AAV4UB57_CAEEX|nr:hypothetical protein CEXT_380821 [Caerostris extrusa]